MDNTFSTHVNTSGDIREARDRTEAAQAYRKERFVKKFNGDKVAAEQYLRRDAERRAR